MTYQARYKKGDRIGGRYLVHQALMGGMGEVYLCLDEEENNPLALKTFQGSDLGMKNLFEEEVANWIALEKHPNIVRLYLTDDLDNIPFMFLEWIASNESKGTDLRSWLRYGALDLPLALRFTIDIVRGLQHANEKSPGIVHRDLKPDNVLVNQSRQAKITDFGLATVTQSSDLSFDKDESAQSLAHSMRVGNVVGTPAYMPPEQWRDETELDFRTDVYAVGCILYEMLTGQWVYIGRTISELKTQHLEGTLPELKGDFPPEVKQILVGCLAKAREDRFDSLDTLIADLTKVYEAQTGETIPDVMAEEMTAIDYGNRGMTYGNLGQDERAIQDYDESIRLDPTSATAYSNRGTSHSALGQKERAIADYNRAIELDSDLATAYLNRGKSYGDLGQHERAIADYDRAIELDPNYALVYSNRGKSYGDLGQHECAIADFDRTIELDPNIRQVYLNRGRSYSILGQHERAIADFDRAIELDPNYTQGYYNRGTSYGVLGQYERAIADFDQVIQLEPNYVPAYSNRGISYGDLGQHERAIADYDRALELEPDNATTWINKGAELANRDQLEEALLCFEKASKLGDATGTQYAERVRKKLGQTPAQQTVDEKLQALRQLIQLYQSLGETRFKHELEQRGIPPEQIEGMIQIVKQTVQTSAQTTISEQEAAIRQMVELYQEHGEVVLRQVLQQNGALPERVEEIIRVIKQFIKGDQS